MENCSIIMDIKQSSEDATDESQLFTKGEFRFHKGSFFIDYDESEATGYEGSHVQLRIQDNMMVMTRTGNAFTSLVFEDGMRHYCHYGMEDCDCVVGITTKQLNSSLTDKGGDIHLRYTVDVNAGLITENEINIKVKM